LWSCRDSKQVSRDLTRNLEFFLDNASSYLLLKKSR
jgi:hypothetical protein